EGLQCDGCQKWNHRTCNTGISRQAYRAAVQTGTEIEWHCDSCAVEWSSLLGEPAAASSRLENIDLWESHLEQGSTEDSMDDPTPMDIDPQPAPSVTYEMVGEGSKRRFNKLIDSIGYSYTFKEKTKTTNYWQCSVRPKGNPRRATVKEQDGSFIPGRNTHSHQPQPGALLAAKIVTCVKQKALDNVFKPATAIVEEEINSIYTSPSCFPQLQIFVEVVELLHREAGLGLIQTPLVSQKKLKRHQRMTYRRLQGKIIGAWEDYSDSKITARQLLQTCSYINGPTRME
ncbi:unnamed protein product, partial [Pocillopora meandrina]